MFSSYEQLLTMLSQGWEIEPPIYVHPRWQSDLTWKKESAYHLILWNGDRVSLVTVDDCPEIRQFLAENELAADRL
jgi:hypothetical protein